MSLLTFGPSATPAPTAPQPVLPTQVKPVVVDNQVRPVSHLRGYIEGMRCVVNYYSQVTDGTSATYGHDVGKSALLQQYRKIKRLEIVLDGDIVPNQNTQDKTFVIAGTAFISTGVVPNEGDVFVMDVGDGRMGVMQVNNSQRMTAMNDSVYQIEFQQIFFSSDTGRFNDMESKVVQELNFVRDFAQFGKDPVVTDTVYADLKALSKIQYELVEDYLRAFTNRDHRLLTLTGQSLVTYDAFTAKALRAIVDTRLHPAIEQLRFLNDGLDDQRDQPTLWDVLLQRRADLLIGCRDRSHAISTKNYPRSPVIRSLRYSGAQLLIFPYSRTPSLEDKAEGSQAWTPTAVATPGGSTTLMQRVGQPESTAQNMVVMHPVCKDGYYVLSEAFYTNNATEQSLLEKLVWDYLQGEGISSRNLHYLVSNHRAWSAPERYFYVPVVLMLMRAALMDAT